MMRPFLLALSGTALIVTSAAPAQKFTPLRRKPKVEAPVAQAGRAPMAAPVEAVAPRPTTTIAQALPTLPAHATMVRLLTAAELAQGLAGPGPFTVFAPTDEAFARLPATALAALERPEARPALARALNYHVIAGDLSLEAIRGQIENGGGKVTFNTVAGEPLTATMDTAGTVELTDVNGGKAYVTQGDVVQANGVIHVVNGVIFPKFG